MMTPCLPLHPPAAVDYASTLVLVVEISRKGWLVGAHGPGLSSKAKRALEPRAEAVWDYIEECRRRAAAAGARVARVIAAYEASGCGFWLARWLQRRGVEVHVIHAASVPVDRRHRRAKSDAIDVDLLLRTLLAWLRGEPRVCTMAPIPTPEAEDARRLTREREELIEDRIRLTNRIDALLATLGVEGYQPRRRDRRERLEALRTALGEPLPKHAKAQIGRLLDRLELLLGQIAALEAERDRALEAAPGTGPAEAMIRALVRLRGVGVQSATVLVREAFVRSFRSAKALGSYAGLTGTPYDSGGTRREQGIGKAGNRRLRAGLVELAWLWLRYQPDSALARWYRQRRGAAGARQGKVLIVALARRLLIALWRFATQGVVPADAWVQPA